MLRKSWITVGILVATVAGVARGAGTAPVLTVNSISMPPGSTATVVVSGELAGHFTIGVTILLEIVPQAGAIGKLEFTPEPPVDITQVGDPWPGEGIFSAFDTGSTFSVLLNGSVDDNGTLELPKDPITFLDDLSAFPVVASAGASGVWDVRLTAAVGDSNWEGLATKLLNGTITVACSQDAHCDDGVLCTDDTCVASACVFTPNDANCAQ